MRLLGILAISSVLFGEIFAQAAGGTITYSGPYTIHTFTANGYFTVNTATAMDIVVVAGGGGGGHQHAGGGGAGGVVSSYLPNVAVGTYYFYVGDGGAGCSWYPYTGGDGGGSIALGITTYGGGAGTGMPQYGNNGGSGGGDGYPSGGVQGGYEIEAVMGHAGSRGGSTSTYNGGGGGGAGTAGWGLSGGAPATTWAGTFGGGGGGGFGGGAGGGAGAGNGGNGAGYGQNAVPNTGSGGGGGGNMDAFGGNGGSGIVVVRYLTQLAPADAGHLVSQNIPTSVNPGQVFTFTQTWTNDGMATWSAAANYNVGAQNPYDNTTWGTGRYATTGTVAPGATATITCTVTAPAIPGYYNLQTGLVHDGVTWFGGSSPNVEVNVGNRHPTNTTSILNGSKAVLATNPTSSVDIAYGDLFYIRVSGTDPDGRLMLLYSRMNLVGGQEAWDYPQQSVSGGSASFDFGPYNTANAGGIGLVNVWTHVRDMDSSDYDWQANGWWGSDEPDINVVKATPSITFADQNFSGTTTMTAGNFNASASNPYNLSVTAPSGALTYSVVGYTGGGASPTSGAVGVGTIFYPGTYTVRATYAGDGFYNATYCDRTFTVADHPPTGSLTIDGVSADKTIDFGRTIVLASTAADSDGHLVVHSFWWDQGASLFWTNPWIFWNYDADATGWSNMVNPGYGATGSSSTRTADFQAWRAGTFVFYAACSDGITWLPLGQYNLTVTKNTPVDTHFIGGTKNSQNGNTYVVQPGDLNAVFQNTHSSTVAAPAGAVSYTIVGPNTPVAVGTVLSGSPTYIIRASYPGDTNYNAATKDATFTIILDPNGDVDNDGMPNQWELDHFGSTTAGDPNGDPDGDGLTNIAEFNLGKNPNVYDAGTSTVGGSIPLGWPNAGINPSVAVGTTAGELSVDKSGALTYSIPIWACPGTAGMEPKISLGYSSQAGNGVAGFGWSLSGMSAITRGGQTKAIDGQNLGATLSANDRFYLDGQRLIVINGGAYGGEGTEYRTEIDSLTKVISHNSGTGPSYFTAWTKAGLVIEFGNTADSARNSSPASGRSEKIAWNVNRITDSSGNFIEFVYSQDATAGTQLLSRINYTGSPVTPAYASLRFAYEGRSDVATGYLFGSVVASLQRLKSITAYTDENVIRTYTLNYTERASASARSLLTSLTETGNDGISYSPLTFEYESPTGGWAAQNFSSSPNYPWLYPPLLIAQKNFVTGAGLMDLNGDGYPDFVRKKNQNSGDVYNDAYLNTAVGFVSSTAMRLPGAGATLAWEGKQDCGGRLIDVNGDGLVDALYADANISYATHNTGTGWDYNVISPTPAGFKFALDTSTIDSGRRLVDINGDGLTDIVWNTSSSDKGCLINNSNGQYQAGGPAWVSAPQWAPPFAIMQNVSSGSQFFDVNGDGLPDLVQFGYSSSIEAGIALNSPTGWGSQNVTWKRVTASLGSSYSTIKSALGAVGKYLPPAFLAKDNTGWQASPIGSEIVDLNGDGRPDILFSNPKMSSSISTTLRTAGAWLNTGDGWIAAPQYTPPIALMGRTDGSDLDSPGTLVADLNGDGLPDLACYRAGQTSIYYLNTGHGWGSLNNSYQAGVDFSLPVPVTNSDVTNPTGFQLLDLNADGITDLIANYDFRYNLAKPTADRLTKVTNGFGVAAQPTYAVLTERDINSNPTVYAKGTGSAYPTVDITGPMLVVKTVNNDDGVGGQYPVNYTYAGLRSSFLYGSLGFSSMRVTDGRTLIASETAYSQDYPFVGMPVHQTTTTSGGVVLSDALMSYGQKQLAGGTRFVFATDSFTTTRDLDGSVTGTVDTTIPNPATDIDDYGNIKKLVVNTDGFVKTTDSVYANDTSKWFLGRLGSATVTSTAPGLPTITRSSSFTYDSATGLLLTETVEPGTPALAVTTTYGYDSFGNKTSVTVSGANVTADINGTLTAGGTVSRATTTQYDFHGRFPSWTRNALSHQEDYYVYDAGHGGLMHMGGANGLPTVWDYDGFGRKVAEHRADGTSSYTTYRWVSGAPAQAQYYGPAPIAKYSVETSATGAAPSLAFYDAFGRAFLGLSITGDGRIVYKTTQYDAQSRAFATSVPYFASGTAYWARTGSFDLLNRPLTTITPDEEVSGGEVTTISGYSGLQATATDPKNRLARTTKNSQGWTTQNTRNENAAGGATASTVTYGYDALGNLTSTTADGATTTLTYDLRGRKTSMVDPDMGTWQYRYNIFGELIWQKDAKGQITTMAYDVLGRMTTRVETEGTTTWTYDTAAKSGGTWKGKLASVSSPGGYVETYDYDSLGRPSTVWRTIPGVTNTTVEPRFFVTQTYDASGRPEKTVYPTGFQTINVYNGFGYLKEVRRADSNRNDVYWMADTYSVTGRVDGEYYGNGLINDRVYSDATGRLRTAAIGKGIETTAPFSIQYLQYNYDAVGNVSNRSDTPVNRTESFTYDGLDRLLTHALNGYPTVSVAYNANGNIASKSDVGNYAYAGSGPHALSGVSGGTLGAQSYTYDADGNMQGGGGRTITWTSFNQVKRVQNSGNTIFSDFTFGASHERIKEVAHTGTTVFIGSLFERVTNGSLIENKHYIFSPTGRIAVRTERNDTTVDMRYFHTDGLGSITAVTNEAGQIVKRFAFDAWGKRVEPSTNGVITSSTSGKFTRGFTDHEQLDDLGLIHMNGRIYDAVLGRFLSADPNVDGVSNAQGYNRYSYVGNNPLGATDPTGYFSLKDIGGAIIGIVVAVVVIVAIVYSGGAFASFGSFFSSIGPALTNASLGQLAAAGAAGGFASGFSGSLLNGGSLGDAFKSGLIGAATGAATAYAAGVIGQEFGPIGSKGPWNEVGRAIAHGAAGGAITEASGGQFRHGFYAGFAGSAAGSLAPSLHLPGYDVHTGSAIAERTAFAAVVGGTASVLGGGKFANGAGTSAFQHLFNAEGEGLKEMFESNEKRLMFIRLNPISSTKNTDEGTLQWIKIMEQYKKDLYLTDVIDHENQFQFAVARTEDDLIGLLRFAAENGVHVMLSSHGNPASDFAKLAFGKVVDDVDNWNQLAGYKVLNLAGTEWYSCCYTYGPMTPRNIFEKRVDPDVRRFFRK